MTVYNHALLASGNSKLLIPENVKVPETYFLKKIITSCELAESELFQVSYLTTKIISEEIKGNYEGEKITINLKAMFGFSEKESLFTSKHSVVGIGEDLCSVLAKKTKKNFFYYNFYKAWISGYLTPFLVIEKLDRKKILSTIEGVYNKTIEHCENEPDKIFAEVMFEVIGKYFEE